MFLNTFPLFNKGRILKLEMLEQLRDYPRDFIDIWLKQYSDGILSGCGIDVDREYIIIGKGIIKYGSKLYMLKKEYKLHYECTNNTVMLKVKFLGTTKNNDFIRNATEIFIDRELNLHDDEMELCRFKVNPGAVLRTDYVDFKDMSTEYDTVNIINTPFSAIDSYSLSPVVLKTFANEAFRYQIDNALDSSFCMLCLQERNSVNRQIIENYIGKRLKLKAKNYSNEQIYNSLLRILTEMRHGRGNQNLSGSFGQKKILVD